jgi:cellulose synthase/poly-beta-1,6-N-acetylglucosamine synthase-like glycosyltransferase
MQTLARILFWISLGWLAYVYLLYPGLMFLLARLRPRPLRTREGYQPSVELITAAWNEERNIAIKIGNYHALDYPCSLLSYQIGSDGSIDATDRIVLAAHQDDPSIRLVRYERVGKTRIIYELAERSQAEIIIFTDADIRLEPDAVRRIVRCFSDPDVGGVVCRMVYHDSDTGSANEGEGLYTRMENALRRWESLTGTTVGPTGQCFAVRRGSYHPLADHRLSDDMHLVISIPLKGRRVWYAEDVAMHEYNSRTIASEVRRRLRVGQQNAATFMEFPETRRPWRSDVGFRLWSHRVLRNLSALPALISFLCAIALSTFSLICAVVVWIGIIWSLLLAAGAFCEWRRIPCGALGHPLFFTLMLASLAIGALRAWRAGGLALWESPRMENAS